MSDRLTAIEIDDVAARWAAAVESRALSEAENRELEAWLSRDSRHLGAYAKALAVSSYTERARALGPNFGLVVQQTPLPVSSGRTRRNVIAMGGMAASVILAVSAKFLFSRLGEHIYSTLIGETRVVPLGDGSVITLNTASSVAVNYSRARRDIRLLAGEALFDVAKDHARPFVVQAGDTQVRAVGTSFTVTLLPEEPTHVLVREGVVEVMRAGRPAASPVRIAANTLGTVHDDAPIAIKAIEPAEVSRKLVWRVGRIAFTGETIREAAETFARYSDTRIIISDEAVANKTIAGLFVSNDPVGFAKAVSVSLNLHLETGENEVRLSR